MVDLAEQAHTDGAAGPSCSYLFQLVHMLRAMGLTTEATATARAGLERATAANIPKAAADFRQLLEKD